MSGESSNNRTPHTPGTSHPGSELPRSLLEAPIHHHHHPYGLRSRSASEASRSSPETATRRRRKSSKHKGLLPEIQLPTHASFMNPEERNRLAQLETGIAALTTRGNEQAEQLATIIATLNNLNVAAPPPGNPTVVVTPPPAAAPTSNSAAPAPTVAPLIDPYAIDRQGVVTFLEEFVADPKNSQKFDKGKRDDINYLCKVDSLYNHMDEDLQKLHVRRLRFFYIVATHNWTAALVDQQDTQRTDFNCVISTQAAAARPRQPRTTFARRANPKQHNKKKK